MARKIPTKPIKPRKSPLAHMDADTAFSKWLACDDALDDLAWIDPGRLHFDNEPKDFRAKIRAARAAIYAVQIELEKVRGVKPLLQRNGWTLRSK